MLFTVFAVNIGKIRGCVRRRVYVSVKEREGERKREKERAGDMETCVSWIKMDSCNLSPCVIYSLPVARVIWFLSGQEYTEIRGAIVREEFYLRLLCVLPGTWISVPCISLTHRKKLTRSSSIQENMIVALGSCLSPPFHVFWFLSTEALSHLGQICLWEVQSQFSYTGETSRGTKN